MYWNRVNNNVLRLGLQQLRAGRPANRVNNHASTRLAIISKGHYVRQQHNLTTKTRVREHYLSPRALSYIATLLLGSSFWYLVRPESQLEAETLPLVESGLDWQSKIHNALDLKAATDKLRAVATSCLLEGATKDGATRYDMIRLESNSPVEDNFTYGSASVGNEEVWNFWGVFDGHAGWATSSTLRYALVPYVARELRKAISLDLDPSQVDAAIKDAFQMLDNDIILSGLKALAKPLSHAEVVSRIAPARSGSCAILAIHDPATSTLRVANVGDSRAVLGRLESPPGSANGSWTAVPLSEDQTGFNEKERSRILAEHPGETDPNLVNTDTGRVIGIAVSRAFGDYRWKWPADAVKLAEDKYNGNVLRPNLRSLCQTPPYLTAMPEIVTTKVKSGDFLIIASDGMWDNISSEHAVECVGQWVIESRRRVAQGLPPLGEIDYSSSSKSSITPGRQDRSTPISDNWNWKANPADFVVEESNAAAHLAKNALGGRRRDIFCSMLSLQPPVSRECMDDITIQVVFFGDFLGRA